LKNGDPGYPAEYDFELTEVVFEKIVSYNYDTEEEKEIEVFEELDTKVREYLNEMDLDNWEID